MIILVTGSLGTLGKPLVNRLVSDGHRVFGLDLDHANLDNYYRTDISEYRQLEKTVKEVHPEFVYHLAAEFGRINGEDYYENLWKSNVIGTKNILELQKILKFKLVLFSSSEVYGDYRGVMTEDVVETIHIRQLNDYAITKYVNELQCLNYSRDFDNQIVRVRIFNSYGPGEFPNKYRSVLSRWLYAASKNIPFDVHRGYERTSIYIEDAVELFIRLIKKFKNGEAYNIANPVSYTMEEYAKMIVATTGCNENLVIYGKDAPIATTKYKKVSMNKTWSDLGEITYMPIMNGLKNTLEWMRSEKIV